MPQVDLIAGLATDRGCFSREQLKEGMPAEIGGSGWDYIKLVVVEAGFGAEADRKKGGRKAVEGSPTGDPFDWCYFLNLCSKVQILALARLGLGCLPGLF